MNTKGNQYGTVRPNGKGFLVDTWNPIEQKRVYLGTHKTKEEAISILNNFNFNLFEKNTWMLPKCISISRRAKRFIFCIQVKDKTMRIAHYKSLDEAVQAKHEFINKLIS